MDGCMNRRTEKVTKVGVPPKNLQSKYHYDSKIHTLLMKKVNNHPFSLDNPPIKITPTTFLQENLDHPSKIFQKSQPPTKNEINNSIRDIAKEINKNK